ncbi:MAG: serine/threonine-protein kinase [Planctomycetota bacterium]
MDTLPQTALEQRQAPQTFGKYRILKELSRGQMGVVYKAEDLSLVRMVALKVFFEGVKSPSIADEPPSTTSPNTISKTMPLDLHPVQRFDEEAKAIASLKHPNIVSLYEWGTYQDMHFFTMDYIEGEHLGLRSSRLFLREALKIIVKIAHALHYAHSKGIIHRDVKPQNILLDPQNNAYLADFGLAKNYDSEVSLTKTGIVFGTPAYMSPEQARGEMASIDGRADVYSLGATLYEVLTGEKPFSGNSGLQVLMKVLGETPKSIREINPNLPRELDLICQKSMAKNREERYPTAEAMASDLEAYLKFQPIEAQIHPRLLSRIKGNPFFTTFYLLAIQVGIFLLLYFLWWNYFSEKFKREGLWAVYEKQEQERYFESIQGTSYYSSGEALYTILGTAQSPAIRYHTLESPLLTQHIGFQFDLHFLEDQPPEKRVFHFFWNSSSRPEELLTTGYHLLLNGLYLEISNSSGKLPWGGDSAKITPREGYQIRIEKLHQKIKVFVDGELLIVGEDYYPLYKTTTFGVEVPSQITMGNFEVLKYQEPNQNISDYLFYNEVYDQAYLEYENLLELSLGDETDWILFQQQLCLYQLPEETIQELSQKMGKPRQTLAGLKMYLLKKKNFKLLSHLDYFLLYLNLYQHPNFSKASEIFNSEFDFEELSKRGTSRFRWLLLGYLQKQASSLEFFQKPETISLFSQLLQFSGTEPGQYQRKSIAFLKTIVTEMETSRDRYSETLEALYSLLFQGMPEEKQFLEYELKYCQLGRWRLQKLPSTFSILLFKEICQRYDQLLQKLEKKSALLYPILYEQVLRGRASLYNLEGSQEVEKFYTKLKQNYQEKNTPEIRKFYLELALEELCLLLEQNKLSEAKTAIQSICQESPFSQAPYQTENSFIFVFRFMGGMISFEELDTIVSFNTADGSGIIQNSLIFYALSLYYLKLDINPKKALTFYEQAKTLLEKKELWPFLVNPFH